MSGSYIEQFQKDPVGYGYSALLALGGLLGFLRRQSLPSLVAGTAFGVLSGYGVQRFHLTNKADVILGATGILTVVMGMRFSKSGKFMPAGLLTLLSVAMLVRYGVMLN